MLWQLKTLLPDWVRYGNYICSCADVVARLASHIDLYINIRLRNRTGNEARA